jgi:ABC-2 type transport system permease protein
MSTMSYALTDSATMLRRNLKRMIRYPSLLVQLTGMPVVFLLLFVYVFGGTLGNGLGGVEGGRTAYVNYVVPGILLMTVAAAVTGTAISVSMDMMEGIVARFRTMAIARVSVLTGHVVASMVQTMIGLAIVTGVALLVGFRPNASAVEWVATVAVLAMIAFALIWLAVAFGLAAKTVESASNLPMPLVFLPFLGSGFVPTDSMPGWLQAFAEHQPFTPFTETVRGLLMGTAIGNSGVLTVAWSAGIGVGSYLWARKLYNRDPVRTT